MARRKPLLKVSLSTRLAIEDGIAGLFERTFRSSPVMETKPGNPRMIASVYLEAQPTTASWARFRQEARELDRACRITSRTIKHEDWAESWKRHFPPLDLGTLLIKPGWNSRQPRRGQHVVVLDPGLSFGTGQHSTTRFCLEELVKRRDTHRPQSMLDVGTGSGILAIAAAKLGYRPVMAVDNDADSVRIARVNAASNNAQKHIHFKVASLDQIGLRQKDYDVVCANLTADVLMLHSKQLISLLRPGGFLILAGILKKEFEAVAHAFGRLKLVRKRADGIWKALTLQAAKSVHNISVPDNLAP